MSSPSDDAPIHLCISGDLGSGKSSVAAMAAKELGLTLLSTGDLQREIAQSLNLSTLAANLLAEDKSWIDDQVDSTTKRLDSEAQHPMVFDSRMAWWFVRRALKVRLIVDPEIAAERIWHRASHTVESYHSLDEAREKVAARYQSETRRFKARYGVDVAKLGNYDLVIDTSDAGIEEIVRRVIASYTSLSGRDDEVELWLSPRRLVPGFSIASQWQLPSPEVPGVVHVRPFNIAVTGQPHVESALAEQMHLLRCRLLAQDSETVAGECSADSLLRRIDTPEVAAWETTNHADLRSYLDWRTTSCPAEI